MSYRFLNPNVELGQLNFRLYYGEVLGKRCRKLATRARSPMAPEHRTQQRSRRSGDRTRSLRRPRGSRDRNQREAEGRLGTRKFPEMASSIGQLVRRRPRSTY